MIKLTGAAYVPGVSRAQPVAGDEIPPLKVDVVVIGGGMVGCNTALNLAERGVSVALCEKGVIGGEASGRSAGMIDYEFRSPIKMEMIAHSSSLWRGMSERIQRDIGYNGNGLLTIFSKKEEITAAQAWLDSVKGHPGVEARIVSGHEAAQIDSSVNASICGALYQPNGACVEPKFAASAIAEAARAKGAAILQHCAVRSISRSAGRINGVDTEKGFIHTDNVVVAGGVWSPALAKQLGLKLPQMMIFAEEISIEPLPGGPKMGGGTPAGYFRPEPDGGYMLGAASGLVPIIPTILKNLKNLMPVKSEMEQEMIPAFNWRTFSMEARASRIVSAGEKSEFEKNRIFQPEILGNTTKKMLDEMGNYIPAFKNYRVREHFSGSLLATLDNLGVVSPVISIPGLYLGTGMLYGLTLGPAAGEAIADLITGVQPKFNLTPYRYERFIDGSKFEFHP